MTDLKKQIVCVFALSRSLAVGTKSGYKFFSLSSVDKLEQIYACSKYPTGVHPQQQSIPCGSGHVCQSCSCIALVLSLGPCQMFDYRSINTHTHTHDCCTHLPVLPVKIQSMQC